MKTNLWKYLLIIPILLCLQHIHGQSYTELVSQAYAYAYLDKDYQKSLNYFEKAFSEFTPRSSELYYAAEISLLIQDKVKFKKFLSDAIEKGYSNYQFLNNKNNFKSQFAETEWVKLMEKCKKNYTLFSIEYFNLKDSLLNSYSVKKIITGKVDLRTDSLTVKHQGRRNTCSVFAASALMEYLYWNKYKEAFDFSESYNYWAAKTFTLNNKFLSESYTSIDGLAGYMAVEAYGFGSMEEQSWPYESTNWLSDKDSRCKSVNGQPVKECFTGVPPQNSKETGITATPIYIDRVEIGQFILNEKKPVVMNIFWHFNAIDEKGNFRIPDKDDTNKGGHVILLVGYDSKSKLFIFKNSWGEKWGNQGYGTIPEEYILNYYELAEIFPYGIDAPIEEKIQAIKGSMGISASLNSE